MIGNGWNKKATPQGFFSPKDQVQIYPTSSWVNLLTASYDSRYLLSAALNSSFAFASNVQISGALTVTGTINVSHSFYAASNVYSSGSLSVAGTSSLSTTFISGNVTISGTVSGNLANSFGFRQPVIKGFIPTTVLTGSQFSAQVYNDMSGSLVATYFIAPWSGSLIALTGKVYNVSATNGAITASFVKNGASYGPTVTWAYTQMNSAVAQAWVPGTYAFNVGDNIEITVTSAGWKQTNSPAAGCEFQMWVMM